MVGRAESQAETQRRLIDAAYELFSARRVHDVSVDQVAKAAGYTKGAVYANFESKTDLLFAVLEDRLADIGPDYAGLVVASSDADLASEIAGRAAETEHDALGFFRILNALFLEAFDDPDVAARLSESRRRHRDQLAAAITTRATDAGIELAVDPADLAAGLIGMSAMAFMDASIDPALSAKNVHDAVVQLVLVGALATGTPLDEGQSASE